MSCLVYETEENGEKKVFQPEYIELNLRTGVKKPEDIHFQETGIRHLWYT